MKRKFRVTIGEKTLVVEVEEVSGEVERPAPVSPTPTLPAKPSVERRTPEAPRMEAVEKVKPAAGEEGVVRAPLSGVILSVKCGVDSEVRAGDPLLTLEAMKMENEIYAPKSGIVKKVLVLEGQTVNYGDVLVVID